MSYGPKENDTTQKKLALAICTRPFADSITEPNLLSILTTKTCEKKIPRTGIYTLSEVHFILLIAEPQPALVPESTPRFCSIHPEEKDVSELCSGRDGASEREYAQTL